MAYHTYWESYSSYLPVLNKQQKTKLDAYFKMLLEEAALYGFIAKAEPEILWLRHILDSLLIFTHGGRLGRNQSSIWVRGPDCPVWFWPSFYQKKMSLC